MSRRKNPTSHCLRSRGTECTREVRLRLFASLQLQRAAFPRRETLREQRTEGVAAASVLCTWSQAALGLKNKGCRAGEDRCGVRARADVKTAAASTVTAANPDRDAVPHEEANQHVRGLLN